MLAHPFSAFQAIEFHGFVELPHPELTASLHPKSTVQFEVRNPLHYNGLTTCFETP
jgi:hypothetical protein